MNTENRNNTEKKLFDTLKDDISGGGFRNDLTTDFEEMKEFFLNDDRKKQIAGMGKIKAFFYMSWWLLKELLLKLTPTRRLVLLIGILLLILPGRFGMVGGDVSLSTNTNILGGILILFVLMLELKDKLLAKDELSAGRTVQRALMSERAPIVPGWKLWLFTQPANDVGGDLVDIIKLTNGKHGVTIADVSGKGLGAALLMAKLQTLIRALTPDFTSIDELGGEINKKFYKDILPNSFASLIYFLVDENSNKVEILNAGHIPPIILSNTGIEVLPKGSIAMGLSYDAKFSKNVINLDKGNTIVAFSDGLTEARNTNGTFFGTERIYQILQKSYQDNPQQIGQHLLEQVYSFIGKGKKYDDLSIVIIRKD